MKAQANGVLNVSTLDGWWDEAWQMGSASDTKVGWAIGNDQTHEDLDYQDKQDAEALYELLEREIVPAFYDRGADGLPAKWVKRMKTSIAKLCPEFNMHRMVMQYTDEYYLAAHRRRQVLNRDNAAKAKGLAAWRKKVEQAWPRICVESIQHGISEIGLDQEVLVSARVFLDALKPEDVAVQVLSGGVDASGEIKNPSVVLMDSYEQEGAGKFVFQTMLRPDGRSGLHGYAIRVLPRHCDSSTMFLPGLITWASEVGATVRELALQS